MDQSRQQRAGVLRSSTGRVVIAAIGLAGLSASVLAVDAASATTHSTSSVVISTVKNAKLGTLLVSGKTLYTLKASKTACTAQCLKIWPEVTLPKGVTKATAGKGVTAAKLGTIKRANGVLQVTYAGKALYHFSGDTAAGQVKGNLTDTWGTWADVVTVKPTTSSTGSGGTGSGSTTTSTGGVAF